MFTGWTDNKIGLEITISEKPKCCLEGFI